MALDDGNGQPRPSRTGRFFRGCGRLCEIVYEKSIYLVGLPIVGVIGTFLASHYQYVSEYEDKVRTIGKEQMVAAETTFTEVAMTFSKAVTLQQLLYVNYRDATKHKRDGDAQAIETKNARALFKQYDDMHTELRESIDLSARRVEITLDWASNTSRDPANAGDFGLDPMSRIALGAYDFQCDDDKYMPNFAQASVDVPVPSALRKENSKAQPLHIDWYSTKHQLLTLYYCFNANHTGIAVVRQWASDSPISTEEKDASQKI